MSLSKKIAAALDENTRAYVLPCTVSVEDGPDRISLHLAALDSVGVALGSLDYATSARPEWTSEALRAWGEGLAARITYLMEPLKVLEVDAQGGDALIRSQTPTTRADQQSYYEIRLHNSGTLKLERYTIDDGTRQRHKTSCKFTREVLERLADDFVASQP